MTINSPYHDVTVTVSLFVFSPPSRQQETEQRGEEQEGGGGGGRRADSLRCGGFGGAEGL